MNEEEIKKGQKKVMIYTLLIALICVIGISYAYFTAGLSSETSTTVRADAGTMNIVYDGGANITLSGIYPRDEVWATKNITVTGNNTTDAEMYYKLTLVVDSNTFNTSDPLQYELVSTNTSTNGEVIPAISKTDITSSSVELGKGHFIKANNAEHTYQLKIYYPKKETSQNDNQGASFNAHVEIESVKVSTLANLILANNEIKTPLTTPGKEVSTYTKDDVTYTQTASVSSTYQAYYFTYGTGYEAASGTTSDLPSFNLTGTAVTSDTYANSYSDLVGKYIVDSYIPNTGSTTAGKMKTTTDLRKVYYVVSATQDSFTYKELQSPKNVTEALLASTEDDYGTSYYFRGAVKNNYVQFANKCWKIVRIVGDGSVKLVLHNDNTSNAANPCAAANNNTTAAFAHYNGDTYKSAFNKNDDNAYIGFMYGTTGSSDYASTHANTNKSTILINLETWYKNNLASYEDKLADTIWCNDKSTIDNELGYGTNDTDYAAINRIYSTKTPSLICPNDNNGGKLSKFTVDDTKNGNGNLTYKIGLLTADEVAFAGATSATQNKSIYLQENTAEDIWWTMSPRAYYDKVGIWAINTGFLSYYIDAEISRGIRPSISLLSTVTATGSGTSEDPYVVN